MREQQPPDEYLLQLRPGAAARGRIVEQTAERAAYWHRARRPRTEQDLADAARAEHDEREKLARDRWGARPPNARLRATLGAGLSLRTISALDPELEFALADVDDEVHRQVAERAVLRCLTQAGLVDRPQLAPAVAALRRGALVEAPFDDSGHAWWLLERMNPPRTSVPTPPDGQNQQSPRDWAISGVFHSAMGDSLQLDRGTSGRRDRAAHPGDHHRVPGGQIVAGGGDRRAREGPRPGRSGAARPDESS